MEYSLKNSPLLKLLLNGKQYKLPKGQILQFSDERMQLSVVKFGYIKRYSITFDGSESIQSFYGPGNVFPLTPIYKTVFNKDIYRGLEVFYYEAIADSAVYSINQSALQEAVVNDPMIYKDLFYTAGVRLGSNIQRLENMSLGSAQSRVAHLLVYLADKYGEATSQGSSIMIPLTHQTLASSLNLARETVTHSITRLHEKELIIPGKHIVVIDIEKLRREAR